MQEQDSYDKLEEEEKEGERWRAREDGFVAIGVALEGRRIGSRTEDQGTAWGVHRGGGKVSNESGDELIQLGRTRISSATMFSSNKS